MSTTESAPDHTPRTAGEGDGGEGGRSTTGSGRAPGSEGSQRSTSGLGATVPALLQRARGALAGSRRDESAAGGQDGSPRHEGARRGTSAGSGAHAAGDADRSGNDGADIDRPDVDRADDDGSDGEDGRARHGTAGAVGLALYTWAREVVIVVVLALALSLIVKTWLLQAFYIPSESMENTLLKGDRVVVSKLTPGPFDLHRGDVVVFADPGHWLSEPPPVQRSMLGGATHDVLTFVGLLPNDEGNHLIKRIIGLPGDRVVCCTRAGLLTVNGTAITEEYLKPGDAPSEMKFAITVPAGRVWVMGDNRSDSGDSRYHDDGKGRTGSVPESLVVGRAMTVVWPLHDVAWLGRGGSTFDAVRSPAQVKAAAHAAAVRTAAAKRAAAKKAAEQKAAAKKAAEKAAAKKAAAKKSHTSAKGAG